MKQIMLTSIKTIYNEDCDQTYTNGKLYKSFKQVDDTGVITWSVLNDIRGVDVFDDDYILFSFNQDLNPPPKVEKKLSNTPQKIKLSDNLAKKLKSRLVPDSYKFDGLRFDSGNTEGLIIKDYNELNRELDKSLKGRPIKLKSPKRFLIKLRYWANIKSITHPIEFVEEALNKNDAKLIAKLKYPNTKFEDIEADLL